MSQEEAPLNLLAFLAQPYFFTHNDERVSLESAWELLQKAQIIPYYENPLHFQKDIQWLTLEQYVVVNGNPGSGLVQVTPTGIATIRSHILPEEWRPIGYQIGRKALDQLRNQEKHAKEQSKQQANKKGGKAMTRVGLAAVIVAGAIGMFLFYHFR